jgi:hypothetical protein
MAPVSEVPEGWPLVLAFDGKGIVMLPGALRPATARAAESAENKLATRLSPGEKNGRKRMCEVTGVCDAAPVPRAGRGYQHSGAEEEKEESAGRETEEGKAARAAGPEQVADRVGHRRHPAIIAAAFDEAERRDPGHQRERVVLIDGNSTQIQAVTAEAERRGVQVTIVIDFIHVLEYVWEAARSFFDKGEPAAEEWAADQVRKILHGKSAQVAVGIRRRATAFGYSGSERAGAGEAARYLDNKREYLRHAAALAKGWPIATGIVEALAGTR